MARNKPLGAQQDGFLQARAAQGDIEASYILLHREVVRLMATGQGGPKDLREGLSKDVWLYFKKDGSRVRMFVEIRERTTPEKIKKKWKEVTTWRGLLDGWQGPWTAGGDGFLFRRLVAQEEELKRQLPRKVHAELARQLNHTLEQYLRDSNNPFSRSHALSLLRTMQPRGKEHEEWIADALESLSRGKPLAWTTGTQAYSRPITGQNVRDRLDTWRPKWKKTTSPPTRDK